MADLFKGKGSPDGQEDFVRFIDMVFGFSENDVNFMKLHPKLYKPEYHPAENNYIVAEDGDLKAAVGAYDSILDVNGERLRVRGIGNVAVHPDSRSKGYMIDCMERSLRDMLADGIDLSTLGGQRQRYMYFSYDVGAPEYRFHITPASLRHSFRSVPLKELKFAAVREQDRELLSKIIALHNARPLKMLRPDAMFLDIARTWASELYAILGEEDAFVGYFISNLNELTLVNPDDFNDVIRNYVQLHGGVSLTLPLWNRALAEKAYAICEGVDAGNSEQFTIFHYQKVVGAFLRFKSSMETLADGEWTTLIHGYAGDERLKISVTGNVVSVEAWEGSVETELTHTEAFALLFALYAPTRERLSPAVRSWFPLPLFVENADRV